MRPFFANYIMIAAILSALSAISCVRESGNMDVMELAETLMEERPDSALSIINSIDIKTLISKEEAARYALLKTIALDKNFVDRKDFDILQPALDFYTEKGTPDEKMRTFFYKGRIYQNRGEDDKAMDAFINAIDFADVVTDSLTLARAYVAQGIIYQKLYKINNFILNNLKSSKIFADCGNSAAALRCLKRAFNGYIMLGNKYKSDSIISAMYRYIGNIEEADSVIFYERLSFAIEFGSPTEINYLLDNVPLGNFSSSDLIEISRAYIKINDSQTALNLLTSIEKDVLPLDQLKFLALKSEALEKLGKSEESLAYFKKYYVMLDSTHVNAFTHDLQFAENRHRLEIENVRERNYKIVTLWVSIFIVAALLLLSLILYFRYRLARANRQKAEHKAQLSEALSQQERTEKEILVERIAALDREYRDLQELLADMLEKNANADINIRNVIKGRIDRLNDLLKGYVTGDKESLTNFMKWAKDLTNDRSRFLEETRLAYTESHPRFIRYLQGKNLSVDEIEYLCLYAMGLRGKDIGNYIKVSGHYNMSSAIRKKLSLDSHNTNIGNFVRNLLNIK